MIYAGEQGPWRSWTHVLSKSNKTIGEKCYQLGWNPDPLTSNSGRPAEDPQPSPPVQPIPPALRSQTVNNRFHSCCLLVRCTSPSILSGSDYADVFAGAQAKISPQPHQTGPTQPRSLPRLSRPAGSWAVLAATWLGSTTPEPPSSTLSTWGSALPAP